MDISGINLGNLNSQDPFCSGGLDTVSIFLTISLLMLKERETRRIQLSKDTRQEVSGLLAF